MFGWIAIVGLLLINDAHADKLTHGQSFGSWNVNCEAVSREGSDESDCFLVQNLVLREGGQRVLQIAVGFVNKAPEPIALLSLPLGIALPPGANLQIDDTPPERIAIERCEPNGCRAGLKLKASLVNRFRNGKQLSITFYDAKREPIVVPLSLDGFEAGLAVLDAARESS